MIIYKITNIITNKVYIGQTVMPLSRRWAQHKSAKRRSPLYSSIMKHGAENFIIEEIGRATSRIDLDKMEIEAIIRHDCVYPKGYNLARGGTIGQSRHGLPPWNKGKIATEDAKFNQSMAHFGQKAWNKGLKTPLAARLKQSKAKIGKHISPNTEFKAGEPSAFKGKKHDAKSKALISQNGNRREVICVKTGVTYPSILAVSNEFNISKSYLRRLILEGKTGRLGLSFKFKETK